MKIRLIISYALNLFDLIMTLIWTTMYGNEIESNPIGLWMLEKNITIPIKVIGVGVVMLILYECLKYRPKHSWISWLILIPYFLLALYHIILAIILIS